MSIGRVLMSFALGISLTACLEPVEGGTEMGKSETVSTYDSKLAAELGADEYGMRNYVLCLLKTGPMDSKITEGAERQEIFAGHFANMTKLSAEKKLVIAGPFIDDEQMRGLYIFNVATIAEAEELVQTDPAVAAGIFVPELTKYYGSAALLEINKIHKSIQKTKIY